MQKIIEIEHYFLFFYHFFTYAKVLCPTYSEEAIFLIFQPILKSLDIK